MNSIEINGKEYEVTEVNTRLTNKNKSVRVALIGVGAYVGVGGDNRLYNCRSGQPLLMTKFESLEKTTEFAEWICKIYDDYFEVWESYPDANIFQWFQWTVDNGEIIYRMTEMLNQKLISTSLDVRSALDVARKEVENSHIQNRYLSPERR